jgi:hypothetical protein
MWLALLLLAGAPLRAQESIAPDWAESAGRPAFRAVQAVADDVFDVASGGVLRPLLPDSLSSQLADAPDGDSYEAFSARLRRGEEHAARLDLETRPGPDAAPEEVLAWSRASLDAHRDAALDALAGTMAERYGLPGFGRATDDYLLDSDHWRADELAPTALLGGAYFYAAGVRADWPAGPLRLGLDLPPGERMLSPCRRRARVSVSPLGSPFSLYGEWSARSSERVGVSWSRRF